MANTIICEIKTNLIQTAQRLASGNYRRLFCAPATEEYALDVINSFDFPEPILLQIGNVRMDDVHYCSHGKTTDFDHLVGVSLLEILFAKHQNLSETEVARAGKKGILHDILKPTYLTHQDGHLSEEQWLIMETHPVKSYNFLKENGIIDEDILYGARDHHRWIKLNPNTKFRSYPTISGEPGLAARITASMDVTDAIARGRSFRVREEFKNGSVKHAIEELLKESDENNPNGIHFDRKIISKFIPLLEKAI